VSDVAGHHKSGPACDARGKEDVVIGVGADVFYVGWINMNHVLSWKSQVGQDRVDVVERQREFASVQHLFVFCENGEAEHGDHDPDQGAVNDPGRGTDC